MNDNQGLPPPPKNIPVAAEKPIEGSESGAAIQSCALADNEGKEFERQIQKEFEKRIINQNEGVYEPDSLKKITEIDFETDEAICEVGLSLKDKLRQLHILSEIAEKRQKRLDVFYDVSETREGTVKQYKKSLAARYGNRVRFIPKKFK